MARHKRESADVLRLDAYRVPIRDSRTVQRNFPFGIFARWLSFMRSQHRPMGRQEVTEVINVRGLSSLKRITEPIEIQLFCHSKIRKWAFDNAYTLIFLSSFFIVTWILMVVISFV